MNGTLVEGFLYEGQLRPVAWLNGAGQVYARFVYGLHVNVPEYMVTANGTFRFITDHLGSVRLVVNAATGAVAQRIDYDEWGEVLADSNPGFQPFGFAGGLYDRDAGLVRFGARDYDPSVGRWTAKDPAGFEGGLNAYEYAAGDPVDFLDFTGLDIWIEGPSGHEPKGHQSINVGDPFGQYTSLSFALDPRHLGSVYQDQSVGGPIEGYLRTSAEQDRDALEQLLGSVEKDNQHFYGPADNCRSYSQNKFWDLAFRYHIEPSAPPDRKPAPWDGEWRFTLAKDLSIAISLYWLTTSTTAVLP